MTFPVSRSRREAMQTNLWVVPTGMVVLTLLLFAVTSGIDREAAAGHLTLPAWIGSGTPGQREVILHQADMILRASEESVAEESDRQDVWAAYASLLAVARDLWRR